MIGKTISHYKILEKLGEGGMGVVYKAEDTRLERLVALKFLPPHISENSDEKARFIHEARSASAINHPNVTTIHGIEESPDGVFIVMEYVEGKTLKALASEEPLTLKRILDIGVQICEGLALAHEKGVVHRDIKSENIMVTARGQVKIMDFGLAKLKGASKLTQTGTTLGTIGYMSPEQASGEEVDQRSDIFSAGVVLYELLTGRMPFWGENQAAIINAILNLEPLPIARYNNQVSTTLEYAISKALAKERDERYQHIDELLADLRRERKALEYARTTKLAEAARAAQATAYREPVAQGEVAEPVPAGQRPAGAGRGGLRGWLGSRKRVLGVAIPAVIALAVVLILFVLEPFRVEMGPKKEAVAKENSLAIMYFDNLVDRADTERLGEIVTNLLITSLSESKYINVVSSQRLYDILKLLGKEGAKSIDRDVATQVATRAGARWMLLGSILQTQPQVILTSQLVDVESGKVGASQRITGEVGEKIFPIVDRLATGLKQDLALPAEAQKEPERKVSDLTTDSPEAYRYLLEGNDLQMKMYAADAQASYRKSIEFDSTFAMPYIFLAMLATGAEQKDLVGKAVKYSNRASEREKIFIGGVAAFVSGDYPKAIKTFERLSAAYPDDKNWPWWLGATYYKGLNQMEPAIRELTRAIEIDPLFKPPYNMLAYAYDAIGDFDKSIWAIDKYISMPPEEANPYDTRGDLYAWNGKLDQAIESYRKAVEVKPDFYVSWLKLGAMHLFKHEYAQAESCCKVVASCPDKETRSQGRGALGIILAYQGKLREALRALDDGLAADRMEGAAGEGVCVKHSLKAAIYLMEKNFDSALGEIQAYVEAEKALHPSDPVYGRDFYVYALVKAGKLGEAEQVLKDLKRDIGDKHPTYMYLYWGALGQVEEARGNLAAAIADYEKADQQSPGPIYPCRAVLALAYLKAGKLGEAVAMFEKVLSRYDDYRLYEAPGCVKDHYDLGRAYDKSGWTAKAIEQYQEFLETWKDADPGIPEVEDARARLAKLKAGA
ncbi:MAG TPA: FlgO family outer membrane protein [bacterium]|nr:FlgO family outer membrane protein [bacterium]